MRVLLLLCLSTGRLLRQAAAPTDLDLPGAPPPPTKFGNAWYDYRVRGEDWTMDECGSRKHQSPIDLPIKVIPSTGTLNFDYSLITEAFTVQNNGHAIAADLSDRGYGGLTVDDSTFNLQSITFHARSEHLLGGRELPLEVHLVHKRYDGSAMAVVAFFVESPVNPRPYEGEHAGVGDAAPDLQLNFFKDPPAVMEQKEVKPTQLAPLDFNGWFNGAFLKYEGSLTAPPCTENVLWFVRKAPLVASNEQVAQFFNQLYRMAYDLGNSRAVMPLANRTIYSVMAQRGVPVAPPQPRGEQAPPSEREFEASKYAQRAQDAIFDNRKELADLDSRLRKVAAAEQRAFYGYVGAPTEPPVAPPGFR